MKTANLTVRIDPVLKSHAQQIALDVDLSLSQVVTAALKAFVLSGEKSSGWRNEWKGFQLLDVVDHKGGDFGIEHQQHEIRTQLERLEIKRLGIGLTAREEAEMERLSILQFKL